MIVAVELTVPWEERCEQAYQRKKDATGNWNSWKGMQDSREKAEAKCHCGKICKNQRCLKIHQSRSGCSRGIVTEQRTDISGCVERRIETLTTLVYNIGKDRFGVEERKERSNIKQTPNSREQKIKQLRKELKDLNRRYKRSNKIENKEEVEQHLYETHSDEEREVPLGYCPRVEEQPTIDFETKEPTWKEASEVVKMARTGSAPGYSGVPYKVYKKCSKILRKIWKLFRTLETKKV
ncbi:unnamed protein product [Mytilus coruscus]|uniref:Reverse transcriptase domain-containing protein n=1 Tax=Mytilus coruscus TaxID=42192 RepID=A0A6J8DTM8_MYTCO|nr:unnamed protein product [Mytilus coruscus]